MYVQPKHSTQLSQIEEDSMISSTFTTITNLPNTIITTGVNAHSSLWYPPTEDQRGELIEDILLNFKHITLSTNTPAHLPTSGRFNRVRMVQPHRASFKIHQKVPPLHKKLLYFFMLAPRCR